MTSAYRTNTHRFLTHHRKIISSIIIALYHTYQIVTINFIYQDLLYFWIRKYHVLTFLEKPSLNGKSLPNKVLLSVKFKLGYTKDHDGGKNQKFEETSPSSGWIDLGLNTTFTLPSSVSPSEADTVTVWVKAADAMGNEKIQRTQVTFDSTPPNVQNLQFYINMFAPEIDFSSLWVQNYIIE